MKLFLKSKLLTLDLILVGIISIFTAMLFPRFTDLLVNSDSYAIMLPAMFLEKFGTYGARLGEFGDVFSPIFYRGGFSLIIYLISPLFNHDWFLTAKFIIQSSYFLSIILVYFIARKIFSSHVVGFVSAVLVIFCYIHSYWSTVLMSEIPTIFLILSSLLFLILSRSKSYLLYISAFILGIAFMFRAEMMILLIPFGILIYTYHKKYHNIFFYIICALFVWLLYIVSLYIFNPDSSSWLSGQTDIFLHTLGTHQLFVYTFVLLLLFLLILIRWPLFSVIPALVFLYLLTKINLDISNILPPFYSYLYHDLPIIISGLFGLIIIYRKSKALFLFFTFLFLPLLLLYFSRGEYRYYVHSIMPFIILSGYFISFLLNNLIKTGLKSENKFVYSGKKVLLFLILLSIITGEAYFYTRPSFLPTSSYEQVVISKTVEILNSKEINRDNLVICSVFSEAIYFSTNISAQDCFNGPEDIKRNPDQKKLIIVEEDISRHQPEFAEYLDQNYSHKLLDESWIVTPYIEKNTTSLPKYPIKWYLF